MGIQLVEKLWGSEEWIVNNELYCGKILRLKKGFRGSIHYHEKKHETFYVLSGSVLIELGGQLQKKVMNAGDVQVIPPKLKHRFTPIEESAIIEFSTHHEDSDTYRESQSEQISLSKLLEVLAK